MSIVIGYEVPAFSVSPNEDPSMEFICTVILKAFASVNAFVAVLPSPLSLSHGELISAVPTRPVLNLASEQSPFVYVVALLAVQSLIESSPMVKFM